MDELQHRFFSVMTVEEEDKEKKPYISDTDSVSEYQYGSKTGDEVYRIQQRVVDVLIFWMNEYFMEDFVDDSLLIQQIERFIESLRMFKRRYRLKRLPSIPFDDDSPNIQDDTVIGRKHQSTSTTQIVQSGVITVPSGFTVNSNPLPFMRTPSRSMSVDLFKPPPVHKIEPKTPILRTSPIEMSGPQPIVPYSPLNLVQSASVDTHSKYQPPNVPIYVQQKRKRHWNRTANQGIMNSMVKIDIHPTDRTLRISSTDLCHIKSPRTLDDRLESTCVLPCTPDGRYSKLSKVKLLDICDYADNIYDSQRLYHSTSDADMLRFVDIPPPPALPTSLKIANKDMISPLKLSISLISDKSKQSKSHQTQNSEIKENLNNLLMTPKTASADMRMNSEVRISSKYGCP